MSTENLTAFLARAESDSALAERISRAMVEAVASVASAHGFPCTAEEIAGHQRSLLPDEALEGVSGGFFGRLPIKPKYGNSSSSETP